MTIRVLVDDPFLVPADAHLRPADERRGPRTAGAAELDRLAGPQFAHLRGVRDPLRRGAAVVTGGGALRAPFVLHAVMQDAEARADREIVRRALVAAWQQAREWGLERITVAVTAEATGGLTTEEWTTVLCETWRTTMPTGAAATLTLVVTEAEAELLALVTSAAERAGRA
jgi:O-acetyl-ADP-ribose deacetylase (regulator of RNase III)